MVSTLVEKIDGNVDYLNPDAYGCVLCWPMEKAVPDTLDTCAAMTGTVRQE